MITRSFSQIRLVCVYFKVMFYCRFYFRCISKYAQDTWLYGEQENAWWIKAHDLTMKKNIFEIPLN